ncbi:MAG: prepilin-type N-terminal cleavage/methylation domain-containing protein [Nitrosomonadales bacterium]|nr:prepilin-type N-terminal cleavage/methylation domain-containing protein [Nitrosomonadales bacterium]
MTGSQRPTVKKSDSGFTLIELAMVLMIVGLLLGGLLVPLNAQMEQKGISETQRSLEEVKGALIGFAMINGRLPCPAQATLATGAAGAGEETLASNTCACASSGSTVAQVGSTACTETSVTGVLPWVTLGLNETDGWGRRYTYRVAAHFADKFGASTFGSGCTPSPTPTSSSFALCSPGVPDVFSAASGGTTVVADVPAIIVSHGKNGYGAYLTDGSKLSGAAGDEAENADNDSIFVSRSTTSDFDDQPVWITGNILIGRTVSAGKLP